MASKERKASHVTNPIYNCKVKSLDTLIMGMNVIAAK